MAFNGSGVFVRLYNWVNDKNAAIKIRADRMDAEMDGMATGLSNCVTRDGQSPATADLPMGGFKHTGVASAVNRTDYATYGQLQDGAGSYVSTVGGTATAITLTPSPAITAYATGQEFRFKAGSAATGATTVAISGLAAKTVQNQNGGAIVSGQWASGELLSIMYDGTNFIARNRNFVTPTITGTATLTTAKATSATGIILQNSAGTTVTTIGATGTTVDIATTGADVALNVANTGTGNTAVFNAGSSASTITVDNAGNLQVGMTGGAAKANIKSLSNSATDYSVYLENAAGSGSTQFGVYGITSTVGYNADYGSYTLQTAGTSRISVAAGGITTFVSAAYGYGAGTGGTVTQITSKATGVTLAKQCGQITMNNAALAANTAVAFTFTNSTIASGDEVYPWIQGGYASATSYTVQAVGAAAGSVTIVLRNTTAGSLSEAVVVGFTVRKAVTT